VELAPPRELLPPGATRWALLNDVAIRTGKAVRTIREWCAAGLLHSTSLVGGYGGVWVAALADGWPVNGPNVESYREHRKNVNRENQAKRRATRASAQPSPRKKSRPRRSASRAL
jgi:hypothetical protein